MQYQNMIRQQSNADRTYELNVKKWRSKQEENAGKSVVLPGAIDAKIATATMGTLNESINITQAQLTELSAEYAPQLTDDTLDTPKKKKLWSNLELDSQKVCCICHLTPRGENITVEREKEKLKQWYIGDKESCLFRNWNF